MLLKQSCRPVGLKCVLILSACCAAIGCGSPAASRVMPGTRSTFDSDRQFDDKPLSDSELTATRPKPPVQHSEAPSQIKETVPPPPAAILGYRVQVHSLRDRKAAETAATQLRKRLSPLGDVQVYLVLEAPYYKVRTGDFRSRSEASRVLAFLKKQLTYRDAWIVETIINPN